MTKWICKGCGKALHPYELTRVGIGVHHYDRDRDETRDGLLNCGVVVEVFPPSDAQKIERVKEIVTEWALSGTDASLALDGTEAFIEIMEALEFNPYKPGAAIAAGASAGD